MSRVGFITLYATGHLNPSIVLGRALEPQGHEVVFFNILDTSDAVISAGLRLVPFAETEYPTGALKPLMQKTGELSGQAAFTYYVERMVLFFSTSFRYLPELIRREKIDLLVIDQVHYGGATIAEHMGIPFVSLANALLVNREDVIPPPVMLWPFDPSPAGIERNRKGWASVDQAYALLLPVINEQRRAWNLAEYNNLVEESFSPLAQICQQPAIFEFPRPQAPATLHLVGHLQNEPLSLEVPFPWEWLDGRPLIYASCGTLQNRLEHVFRAIIEACAPVDAQIVIALGKDALSPELFGAVPANIKLVAYTPQAELLRRASLCILHAGLNTTLDCLENGVPMVVIPIASEQPGIAMRVARLGAGTVVPLAEASAASIGTAVQAVLTQPAYREAAQSAAREIAHLHPTTEAVRIIEQVLASNFASA
ncbi:MAG TPA: nucleotide disphospho-sugar-binding domain-containing protein [Edaphobacter sp.]|nr:nucleotide disphospho-sugar-binding domain-containing protein [Edaphobacter sp.]